MWLTYLFDQLRILTLNCQELWECRDFFKNLKEKSHNVNFLGDKHFNDENNIITLWGY